MGTIQLKQSWMNIVLFVIVLLAGSLFLIGYNYSIPILSKDEGWLLGIIFEQRGLAQVADLPGYPPVILFVFSLVTSLVDLISHGNLLEHTGDIIVIIRLIHVFVNLITLLFLYGVVKRLSNPLAALFAALIWALAPAIFEQIRPALSEAWLVMFITGSAFFMLETLAKKQAWLAIASTIMGLLAVACKYNVAPILSFGLVAVLFLSWKDKKSWLKVLAIQLTLILAWACLLLFGYGAIGMIQSGRPTATAFLESGFSQLFNISEVRKVFQEEAHVLSIRPVLWLVLMLVGGSIYLKKAELAHRIAWLMMLLLASFITWFVASYLIHEGIAARYVAASSSLWIALIVTSTAAISQALPRKAYAYLMQAALLVALFVFWLLPLLRARIVSLESYMTTDTRVSLSEWSSRSLPAGTIALDGQHWFIYDPIWGGYQGPLRPWVARERWLDRPLEDWQAADIRYVQLQGAYPGDTSILPFDNIYHLKSFPIPEQENQWTGDSFHIYQLVSDNFLEVDMGFENGINLAAYDLSDKELVAGETLSWIPYWQASQVPTIDYQVFLHLVPMDSFEPITQLDLSPAIRLSSSWDDENETIVGNLFQLTIPNNLESGTYRLIVGLYRLDTFERLHSTTGLDYLELSQIQIGN